MKKILFLAAIAASLASCKKEQADVIINSFSPTEAHWGETVTITGTGFSETAEANTVTFNGIAATVISASKTELTVEVPKNLECSGALKVEVKGKSATATGLFTYLPTYTVSTIAGNGKLGFVDGSNTNARFCYPGGVAIDVAGNIIVADMYNQAIRKIDPQGNVTTIAGNGEKGFVNAQGANARFQYPYGVAVDVTGNIIVADTYNHAVRKIDLQGNVTTIAGNGTTGFVDAQGADARFYYPSGVTIDASGNIIVADMYNHAIRKIDPQGNVTTIAGNGETGLVDGSSTDAMFYDPTGIAVDAQGNIIVADGNNHAIRKIDPQGNVTTIAGNGTSGFVNAQGEDARFKYPFGVAVDAQGNIIVTDAFNSAIRKIDSQRNVTTIAGNGTDGFVNGQGADARFYNPYGVTIDAMGNIIVADYSNDAIRKITAESN